MAGTNGTRYFSWQEGFERQLGRNLDNWAARKYAEAHGLPIPRERREEREEAVMPPSFYQEGSRVWAF